MAKAKKHKILFSITTIIMTPVNNANNQEIQRQKCEVYTRVMGYHRPVSFYNEGKKSEFYSRTYYKVEHPNQVFNAEFGCGCGKGDCDEDEGN